MNSQPQLANWCEITKNTQQTQKYFAAKIGDAVFCRDHENRSWLSGVIVSLKPLEIQVQGWPIAMSFKYVCQNLEGKTGNTAVSQQKCYQLFPKEYIRHLIGENGKKIKAIRASSNAQIKVFDDKTSTIDDEKAKAERRHNTWRYHYLVRITGSSHAVSCAKQSIRKLLCTIREYEKKQMAWIRRKYRKKRAYSVRSYKSSNSVTVTWEMQKQQHGANGCWVTRKFKNKGKHRSAPRGKAWKRKYYGKGSKKNVRKPNRKYTIELANNRRLSL